MEKVWIRKFPTVFYWEIGKKEGMTPHDILGCEDRVKQLEQLEIQKLPEGPAQIEGTIRREGILLTFPFIEGERYYGLGLQLQSFLQNGKRKRLTTNADAVADTGDSHAPVPFFISSSGYGILIDTAGCVEIDFGCSEVLHLAERESGQDEAGVTTEELYVEKQRSYHVTIYGKAVGHLGIYCFAGASIKQVVECYNLFCGGGCLPPLWGLGNLYRCYTRADQKQVETMLGQFVEEKMPFSMLGLEPGWHSHSYSCSFLWDEERFPVPGELVEKALRSGMQINVWEQPYVDPKAAFYEEILPYSGSHAVWGGAAPDFAHPGAGRIYGKHQKKLFMQGVGAVKLDECDGSDYTGGWFFPDYATFPSGLTGEEEKNLYGAMVMRAIRTSFDELGRRTWSQVRANYSYGAPMPFVLYSDLYDHRQFVRGMCNAGLSGLLWSPEVRQCGSEEEFIRRMQTVIFSPLSIVNAWMIPNPPWKQYEIEKNKAGEFLEEDHLQHKVRELLELRNRLVPYLYTSFYWYWAKGTPPFRPLVMDYPEDAKVWERDDCYMMGESLLIAPVIVEENGRTTRGRDVYLPRGTWYDFWTGESYDGGRSYWLETEQIPVFVRENTLLPLAEETQAPTADRVFHLQIRVYGENPEPFYLLEDDGEGLGYTNGEQKLIVIQKENGVLSMPVSKRYVLQRE